MRLVSIMCVAIFHPFDKKWVKLADPFQHVNPDQVVRVWANKEKQAGLEVEQTFMEFPNGVMLMALQPKSAVLKALGAL